MERKLTGNNEVIFHKRHAWETPQIRSHETITCCGNGHEHECLASWETYQCKTSSRKKVPKR